MEVSEQYADNRRISRRLAAASQQAAETAEMKAWEAHLFMKEKNYVVADATKAAAMVASKDCPPQTLGQIATLVRRGAKYILKETELQCEFVRDVFGYMPFRSVTLNPAWLTSTVQYLSAAIYEERAFDRLPIMADALEEAGCTSDEILRHCRQGGEHVRGCWVIDLVTDRK